MADIAISHLEVVPAGSDNECMATDSFQIEKDKICKPASACCMMRDLQQHLPNKRSVPRMASSIFKERKKPIGHSLPCLGPSSLIPQSHSPHLPVYHLIRIIQLSTTLLDLTRHPIFHLLFQHYPRLLLLPLHIRISLRICPRDIIPILPVTPLHHGHLKVDMESTLMSGPSSIVSLLYDSTASKC